MQTPEFYELFGRLVRKERIKRDWSQAMAADHILGNIDKKGEISRVETGTRNLEDWNIRRYCDALGISSEKLASLNNRMYRRPPKEEFRFKSFGKLELPVAYIFGDPEEPYFLEDFVVTLKDEVFHESERFPAAIKAELPALEEKFYYRIPDRTAIRDNEIPRMDDFSQEGEGQRNERGRVILKLSKTKFIHYCATNRSLEEDMYQGGDIIISVREALAPEPLELSKSFLGNPYSVHVAIISVSPEQSPIEQVSILKRKDNAPIYPGFYQSVAGYGSLAHVDASGTPSPFATAVDEAKEEFSKNLDIHIKGVKITGLCMSNEDLDLNFCSFFVTKQTAQEILNSTRRDAFEGQRSFIPWHPKSVIDHIVRNKWEPVGAYNMIMSLIAYFGVAAVDKATASCKRKPWFDFLEHDV